jgi:hypothetical protein
MFESIDLNYLPPVQSDVSAELGADDGADGEGSIGGLRRDGESLMRLRHSSSSMAPTISAQQSEHSSTSTEGLAASLRGTVTPRRAGS